MLVPLQVVSIRRSADIEAACTYNIEILSVAYLHYHESQHELIIISNNTHNTILRMEMPIRRHILLAHWECERKLAARVPPSDEYVRNRFSGRIA